MAVYVDQLRELARRPRRGSHFLRRWWCHLFADSLDELHAFAGELGLERRHFQERRLPHYDLAQSKRRRAVELGAQEITTKEALRRFARPQGGEP